MRPGSTTTAAAALLTGALILVPGEAGACNVRGAYCGYPLWAANAFSEPWERVNPNSGPILPSVGPEPGARRHEYAPPVYGRRGAPAPRHQHRRQRYH